MRSVERLQVRQGKPSGVAHPFVKHEVLRELYGGRYPGFDPRRLGFVHGLVAPPGRGRWQYRLDWRGPLLSEECAGPLAAAAMSSQAVLVESVAALDALLRRAWELEAGGPTGAHWAGWRW